MASTNRIDSSLDSDCTDRVLGYHRPVFVMQIDVKTKLILPLLTALSH